jgi:hypothetical protein
MAATIILILLLLLLIYFFFFGSEPKTYRRMQRYKKAEKKPDGIPSSGNSKVKQVNKLQMPDYYEEIMEKDKLKKNYLNLHERL